MKIYSTEPEGNQMADVEPARYFNLAIKQLKEGEVWLRTSNEICQPVLVHIDILIHLSKKYPEMAKERMENLNRNQLKETFYLWLVRCEKKIPANFRDGIKESADRLFSELEKI